MNAVSHTPANGHDDESASQIETSDRICCLNCEMTNKAKKCNYNNGENAPCNGCQRIPGERRMPLPCYSANTGRAHDSKNVSSEPNNPELFGAGEKNAGDSDGVHVPSPDSCHAVHSHSPQQSRKFQGTYAMRLLLQQLQPKSTLEQEATHQREIGLQPPFDKSKIPKKRTRSHDDAESHPATARRMTGKTAKSSKMLAVPSLPSRQVSKHLSVGNSTRDKSRPSATACPSLSVDIPHGCSQPVHFPQKSRGEPRSVPNGRWLPLTIDVGHRAGQRRENHVSMHSPERREDTQHSN